MHGHGTKKMANGDSYNGEWKNDKVLQYCGAIPRTKFNLSFQLDIDDLRALGSWVGAEVLCLW